MFKLLYKAGDRLEDKVRGVLSHYPIVYAFIGGAGVVIFWRGIWHSVDALMEFAVRTSAGTTSVSTGGMPWWDGPLSIALGTVILLTVGLFVSNFIGNEIIISGLKKEKKIAEKTEQEIDVEIKESDSIKREIHRMDKRLRSIETLLNK